MEIHNSSSVEMYHRDGLFSSGIPEKSRFAGIT